MIYMPVDECAIGDLAASAKLRDPFTWLSRERKSVRAFTDRQIADETLMQVVEAARRAPSGANLQPGSIVEVCGEVRQRLCKDLVHRWRTTGPEEEDYDYFPKPMPMLLRKRQVASARALYTSMGVEREDRVGRDAHFERNLRFFDAPVALIVTIDGTFGKGGYMDLGMMIYGLMLAARSRGLASCAIGALASYPDLIRCHLGLNAGTDIVCGVALGYADDAAPVNRTRTARSDLAEFFRRVG